MMSTPFCWPCASQVPELKDLNLLGVQFAICEGSKYIFFLHTGSGPIYKPAVRDFTLTLKPVSAIEAEKLASIWKYWAQEPDEESADVPEDGPHPDEHVDM